MKINTSILYILFAFISSYSSLHAQSLLETLDKEQAKQPQYELSTFKATHLAIGQSVENRKEGVLQVMLMNRYWNLPTKVQSFIADKWSARIGLEYGITDRLTTGGGWTTFENIFDGYLKYNLIRQLKNSKKSVSVTLFQNTSYTNTSSFLNNAGALNNLNNRFGFTSQVLIARKFTPEFSAQITPTYVHRTAALSNDPKNQFALGIGGRYKVKPHVSIVSEYYYVTNPLESRDTYGAFALGVNWDVRFLMLQFKMTNAVSMVEDRFITQTSKNFNTDDGNFFFGFNAIFTIHTKQKKL